MQTNLRPFVLSFALALSASAHAAPTASQCPQFYPGAMPQVPADLYQRVREVCFDAYAVWHSGQTRTPVIAIERLTREQIADAIDEERTNRFYPEARLPSADRAQLDDYRDSGYDRGHLSPAGNQPDARAMAQSFSLANIVPQAPRNNRGPWAGIEKATRAFAMRSEGPVYVFTGPVFRQPVQTIGPGQVWVPSHLYKLVYDKAGGRAWAHWIDNTDAARQSRPISYQTLVERTGIEFLPGVPLKD